MIVQTTVRSKPDPGGLHFIGKAEQLFCPSTSGNMAAQDKMFSTPAAAAEELPSPFAHIPAIVCDHSDLPTRFGGLVENAFIYISGFFIGQILRKLSCDVCRANLVQASYDQS